MFSTSARKVFPVAFSIFLAFILLKASSVSGEAAPSLKKALARKYDAIVVRGDFLRALNGVEISKLALFAVQNDALTPIPFQVDERDRKGQFVMTAGKTARKDEDNGLLDGNDELVFIAGDAGDRLPEAERASRIEIEITDPRFPDKHAWAYLGAFKDSKPPRSSVDYVSYDQPSERIVSKNYILGYRKGYMFYNDLIYPVSAGGNGKDIFDRIKFRIRIEFFKGRVTLVRTEDMVKAEVTGWIDGPVRVLQATINYAKVFDVLPPVSFNSTSEYYPHVQTSPIIVKFPFDLASTISLLGVKSIIADVYGDMPGLIGGSSYTNINPQGFTYTGHTTKEELGKIPKMGLVWGFSTKKGVGTWFPRIIFPDTLYRYNSFYITDDEQVGNPPDDVPGEIGAGLRLDLKNYPDGVNKMMSQESFMLKFETYFAKPGLTPDEAREWLDIQDYPLLVDARAGSALPTPKIAGKIPAAPPWKGGCNGTITDVRNRKYALKFIAFFVGGADVDARNYFPGEKVSDGSVHLCPIAKMKYITNYTVDFDPKTKTRMAMFSKVGMTDGTALDLLGCRSCGWAGLDEEGRVVYFNNAQIQRVDFSH